MQVSAGWKHNLGRQAVRCFASQPLTMQARPSSGARHSLHQTLDDAAQEASPLTAALLKQSMDNYLLKTPSAAGTVDALAAQGGIQPTIWHDHFAYRTLGLPGLGIASMAAVLQELGYRLEEDSLLFPAKKLTAAWFAHTATRCSSPPLPRIFVSEIEVHRLSPGAQAIIKRHAGGLKLGPAQVATACCTGTLPWPAPSKHEYDTLFQESDYAAWVMVHGYALNHTALSVHSMTNSEGSGIDIQEGARLMEQGGITMNREGGLIKKSPDGLLQQCSSMSDMVACTLGGEHVQLPGSYLELVERLVLPQHAHLKAGDVREWHRRDGFEVSNATHLFTSTRA